MALLFFAGTDATPGATKPATATLGPLYPITEVDLLAHIEDAARGVDAAAIQEKARRQAGAYATRPPPVAGLAPATEASSRLFDPSVRLSEPVVDVGGVTLAAAGTLINPLDKVKLAGRLVLIDERDARQAKLAARLRKERGKTRVILVGGSPGRFADTYGGRVYFDQQGLISRRFLISEIPAMIRQEGKLIRIDVFPPDTGLQ